MTLRRAARILPITLAALLLPAPIAHSQTRPAEAVTASDRQEGARAHAELVQQFGGAMTGPQADYIESIGKNIAVQSGLGNARGDFTVTLLNSSVENAFANPGGYIYLTRQLAALANNEAELAAVLGHEVGHVAARHSAKRQSAAQRNSIIGALGSVLSGVLLGNSQLGQLGQQLFSAGPQLLTLKYSRKQETQADNLSIGYLRSAGYDPTALPAILQRLAAENGLESRLRGTGSTTPAWASTHPDPASRVRAALTRAGSPGGLTNQDTYLSRIDGMLYGDDPHQGVVDGRSFIHPDLRLTFAVLNGSYLLNGSDAVSIGGQNGQGRFTTRPYSGDLDSYVRAVFASLNSQARLAPAEVQRTTVNGLPAGYGIARVSSGNGQVDVVVFAYEFSPTQAYHFATITPAGRSGVFEPMYRSLRRITAAEAAAVRPRILRVVTVRAGDTVNSLAARMAYSDAPLERFLVLNGLQASSQLTPGQKVKIVTY